jgi:hypothetical protein
LDRSAEQEQSCVTHFPVVELVCGGSALRGRKTAAAGQEAKADLAERAAQHRILSICQINRVSNTSQVQAQVPNCP